jgi:hypothetical protein
VHIAGSVIRLDGHGSTARARGVSGPADVRERLATIIVRDAAVWKAARIPPVQKPTAIWKITALGLHTLEERALAGLTFGKIRK